MTKSANCLYLLCILFLCSCKQSPQTSQKDLLPCIPQFNPDSAYSYIYSQVAFGPRVPNTIAHERCGMFLADQLRRFGANVTEQQTVLQTYNNQSISIKNIIGAFSPQNSKRILLCAHWDSRPFADQDPNPDNHHTPIDGANDGASACAVLLEIARQIAASPPKTGVDIIFFDAEDGGTPEFEQHQYGSSGWCLGSEYWAKNPHVPQYSAQYGILLDMVGNANAQFYKENISITYANHILKKIWEKAQVIGYGAFFIDKEGGTIIDDHLPICKYRQIPCVDIVDYNPQDGGFCCNWHTLNDNIHNIRKETLTAVGQTLLHIIFSEL